MCYNMCVMGALRLLTGVQKTKRLRKKAIVIVIVIVKLIVKLIVIVIVVVVVVVKGGTPYNPPYRFSTVYKKSSAYLAPRTPSPMLRTSEIRLKIYICHAKDSRPFSPKLLQVCL